MRLGQAVLKKTAQEGNESIVGGLADNALNAALSPFGGASQFDRTNYLGAYQTGTGAEADARNAASVVGARDTARNAINGAIGILGAFPAVRGIVDKLTEGIGNENLAPGRSRNEVAVREAQARQEALQSIGAQEFKQSLSGDLDRLLSGFGLPPGLNFVRNMNDQAFAQLAPVFQMGIAAAPEGVQNLFSQTNDVTNYVRIAQARNGGVPPTPEEINGVKAEFDQYIASGVFPESLANDRVGAMQAMLIAAESGDPSPQNVGQVANYIDTMFQESGNTISPAVAGNLVRWLGPESLKTDPQGAATLAREIGEGIQTGRFTADQAAYAVSEKGLIGLRALSIAGEMQGATGDRGAGGNRDVASSVSSGMVERLGNERIIRRLDAYMAAGSDRQKNALRGMIDNLNKASTPQARARAWSALQDAPRSLSRLDPGRQKYIDQISVFGATGFGGGSGMPLANSSVLDLMSNTAVKETLLQSGSGVANDLGAPALQAALRGDRRAVRAFQRYLSDGTLDTGVIDPRSLAAISRSQDPRMLTALRMRIGAEDRAAKRARRAAQVAGQKTQAPAVPTPPAAPATPATPAAPATPANSVQTGGGSLARRNQPVLPQSGQIGVPDLSRPVVPQTGIPA